ncbi:MAG: hypothetical protein R2824_29455 [Saprospiraceae bacterium]|nr:hypothetical protein [Lewinella sp.]
MMKKHNKLLHPLILVICFLYAGIYSAEAQCDSLELTVQHENIVLSGESPGDPAFLRSFSIQSNADGVFRLELAPLLGEDDIIRFEPGNLDISPDTIQLKKEQSRSVDLILKGINSPGYYRSSIRITPISNPDCTLMEIPLEVHYYSSKELKVDGSALLEVKTTAASWINFLLPKNITEDTLLVSVRNESQLPIKLDRYSLLLTGALNRRAMTDSRNLQDSLLPGEAGILRFPLPNRSGMVPDRYDGDLQLKFTNLREPVILPVKLAARQAPVWPLIFLMLGIILGRMFRSLDAAQDQIALFESLTPHKDDIDRLKNPGVHAGLMREYNSIRKAVEKVSNATEAEPVSAQIKTLEQKITHLADLQEVEQSLSRSEQGQNTEIQGLIIRIRKSILEGNFAQVKEDREKLRAALNKLAPRSKGISLPDGPEINESLRSDTSLQDIITSIDVLMNTPAEEQSSEQDNNMGVIEKYLRQLLQFLSGVDIGVGVKYWFYRPLALAILFIFILLIGFKEIYIDGGDYFGAEGLFNYVELFTWGLASDLFTRELIGKQLIGLKGNFLKSKDSAAKEGGNEA